MAFDAYLKLDGIEGESTDRKHDKWIEILSYSSGMQQESTTASAGGAHTGGRVNISDITVVKMMDSSTPNLQLACCQGKSLRNAVIEFCRAGGEEPIPFLKVELTNVLITGVTPQASGGSDFPTEEVTMTFGTVKWTYTKSDTTGSPLGEVVTGWDLVKNEKM